MTANKPLLTALVATVLAFGCSADDGNTVDGGADGATDAGDTGPDTAADGTPTDTAADDTGPVEITEIDDDMVCDEMDLPVHHEIVRIMILLDQSGSMGGFGVTKWDQATDALQTLLLDPAFTDMHFGLDAFPDGYPGGFESCGSLCMGCIMDACGIDFPPHVAIAPATVSAGEIITHMNDPKYPPLCSSTPLVNQMAWYDTGPGPTEAPELYSATGTNYLLVVSDGFDENCFDGDPVGALGDHTQSILDDHGIRSFAIGFGDTSGDMAAQLDAIASNGGTSYTSFLHAEDGDELADALQDIASSVITCTYVLSEPDPSADPTQVNFYRETGTGPEVIPMDEDCTEDSGAGWHWVEEYTTVEFCGDYCTEIKEGSMGTITATFGCPTILI